MIGTFFLATDVGLSLYWLTQNSDATVFLRWVGLAVLPFCYAMLCSRDIFAVETASGTWYSERGVWPFVRQETGPLIELAGIESRRLPRSGGEYGPAYDVWAIRMLWREERHAPLELAGFDIPVTAAERTFAFEKHSLLAQAMHLPLLDSLLASES